MQWMVLALNVEYWYNSHATDDVREYLLNSVRAIVGEYDHVGVITFNGTDRGHHCNVYFEGTSIPSSAPSI
jgi:hypothetical protein